MYVGYADATDLVKEEEHLEALITAMSAGKQPEEARAMLDALETLDSGERSAPASSGAPRAQPAAEPAASAPVGTVPSLPGALPAASTSDSAEEAAAGIAQRERWHRIGGNTGTSLRAAIFGVNDGLVSNLSLVMGVAGAEPGNQFVILAGVAGLLAGSFSMAAGEYVSIQSQREMFERQIALERDELEENPEEERAELALIYQAKGLPAPDAERLARTLMHDKRVALDTLAREELGLDPDELGSPWGAAISSFAAFSLGAIVPVVPYLLVSGFLAFFISVILSAIALFLVGAGVSLVTGRGLLYSAVRMVLIGGLAAIVTYLVGKVIGVSVAG
ncbi:MAG: VIT1/CCC1 transporter family protein [Chloroflexi bacterium]|nr:VIT1/CCC1 transporter family protein [Chloroflexota bacterium]